MTWDEAIAAVARLRFLRDDWDGEGTPAPDPAAVDWATRIIEHTQWGKWPPPDRVSAGVNGAVWVEWWTPDKFRMCEATASGPEWREIARIRPKS